MFLPIGNGLQFVTGSFGKKKWIEAFCVRTRNRRTAEKCKRRWRKLRTINQNYIMKTWHIKLFYFIKI